MEEAFTLHHAKHGRQGALLLDSVRSSCGLWLTWVAMQALTIASEVGESLLIDRRAPVGTLLTLCLLILISALHIQTAGAAGSEALMVQRPPGWRWEIEPLPVRRPQPSLSGSTGYFDLLTTETLQPGNYSIGLFGTFEKVFTAEFRQGDDRQRLRLDRYSAILGGAYGIRDDLELGLAIPGVHTAAESKQSIGGETSSGDVHETRLGNIHVGLKWRPFDEPQSAFASVPGLASIAFEPFVDIQTHGHERGISYPYRDQDTVYGINLLMSGNVGPVGVHWNFGYSRTDGRNVDNFLVLGSPFNIDGPGLSDGERLSYALGFNVQPLPPLNLVLEGRGDTSARHPWGTREDHRVSALVGAIYGFPNGLAVHAGWQVDLHDPVADDHVRDLDYRVITGVTYSFKKTVAAPPPPAPSPPPLPPPSAAPPERRVERIVLQSVHFEFDQSRLTALGRRVLDEAAQKLMQNPTLLVEIEGHTDSIGTELYNLGLGKRRAEVVKGYLVLQHQLDPKRLTTLSYGEARPIADNRTQQGRALNRRVEFKVLIR
jgi:outer membrane protein OmpA-like peptidoglycan-associated protein